MRKRVSRPRRFAAIDNDAIDRLPSVLGVGLLTCLIRAKDGDDVTVESLAGRYEEGEKSLTKAMRSLVEDAYVVKFKVQRATSESVVEDGKDVVKRGGSWYTTFTVDSIPFSREDVAAMVEEIYAEGNVKSHRVEPTHLDPRNAPGSASERPTPPKGGVGPTWGNAPSEVSSNAGSGSRPTPPSGALGRPTPGQGGAHIRNKTSSTHTNYEDESDAPSGRSPVDVRRTSSTGSSACARECGFAASSKTSLPDHQEHDQMRPGGPGKSSSKAAARHTRAQLEQVRAVRAFFPADFLAGLPDVPAVSDAVLSAMAEDDRTVEQLGERIVYRWDRHGWADKHYAGEILSPVGAAVAMVRPLRRGDRFACADPRCENGRNVDTGAECRACEERIADRRAERRRREAEVSAGVSEGSVPAQRPTAASWWDCATCPASGKGAAPADGVCRNCRERRAAAGVGAVVVEDLSGTVDRDGADAAAYEEFAAEEQQSVDDGAEETARLRAMYAAQYGTSEQRAAYSSAAPF
ncbi:hypothetical protein [Streptomyces sp. NRRL F-5135]|uniref:hypothetical protein n=1 Tax=Streptomyces sp. NRRL F-5135 TaxID=1463858 RepID=UPI0004C75822|nr:hypothetical protein [Streptomyces sp. NRRL F-5135]